MTILITGSNGLLGQKLLHKLRQDSSVELIATSKGKNRVSEKEGYTYFDLDITNNDAVANLISNEKPQVVINTAAMTNVDLCEDEKQLCDSLNVDAVSYLADACANIDAHLIQISNIIGIATEFPICLYCSPFVECFLKSSGKPIIL